MTQYKRSLIVAGFLGCLMVTGCSTYAEEREATTGSAAYQQKLKTMGDDLYRKGKVGAVTPPRVKASAPPKQTAPAQAASHGSHTGSWSGTGIPDPIGAEAARAKAKANPARSWRKMSPNALGTGMQLKKLSKEDAWAKRCDMLGLGPKQCTEWQRKLAAGECGTTHIQKGAVFGWMGFWSPAKGKYVTVRNLHADLVDAPTDKTSICQLTPTMYVGIVDEDMGCGNPWRNDIEKPHEVARKEECVNTLFLNVLEREKLSPEAIKRIREVSVTDHYSKTTHGADGKAQLVSGGLGHALRSQFPAAVSERGYRFHVQLFEMEGNPLLSRTITRPYKDLGNMTVTGRAAIQVTTEEFMTKALVITPIDGGFLYPPSSGRRVIGVPMDRCTCDESFKPTTHNEMAGEGNVTVIH